MNTLVWKLLRQHISIGQLAGFFLANLFGMMIVLLSVQFYKDVIPVFTEGDSFMKNQENQYARVYCRKKQYVLSRRYRRSEKTVVYQNDRSFHSFSIQSFGGIGDAESGYSSLYGYVLRVSSR